MSRAKAELALVANAAIWGATFVLVKEALGGISPALFLASTFQVMWWRARLWAGSSAIMFTGNATIATWTRSDQQPKNFSTTYASEPRCSNWVIAAWE